MDELTFPMIDMAATGENILQLRKSNGLTILDMQRWLNFAEPCAIYKWQQGECLPSEDNLRGLSALFHVPIDRILVGSAEERGDTEPFMDGSFLCANFRALPRFRTRRYPVPILSVLSRLWNLRFTLRYASKYGITGLGFFAKQKSGSPDRVRGHGGKRGMISLGDRPEWRRPGRRAANACTAAKAYIM